MTTEPNEGSLRLWWIPQVPGKPFHVPVASVVEAILVFDTMSRYDTFLLASGIRENYSSAGGLEVYEDGKWSEWEDEYGCGVGEIMSDRWNYED